MSKSSVCYELVAKLSELVPNNFSVLVFDSVTITIIMETTTIIMETTTIIMETTTTTMIIGATTTTMVPIRTAAN